MESEDGLVQDDAASVEDPHLRSLLLQFQSNRERINGLVSVLTPEQANQQPAPGSWSVNQCIEHLIITAELYITKLDPAVTKGREQGKVGSGRYKNSGIIIPFLLKQLNQPGKRSFKAPKEFLPTSSDLDVQDVLKRYNAANEALQHAIVKSDGLNLNKIRFSSPVTRLLRMSLGQALEVIAAHERRHIWQAGRVVSALNITIDESGLE